MSPNFELPDLRKQLSATTDPAERREIIARMLAQVQLGWSKFVESLADEQNPKRMLLMLADLEQILDSHQAGVMEEDRPDPLQFGYNRSSRLSQL